MTLLGSKPAPWIAEQAAVSANTARDHLSPLVDLGVVTATDDSGTRHYYPDPLYTRLRDIRVLLEETTKQELSEQATEAYRQEAQLGSVTGRFLEIADLNEDEMIYSVAM